MTNYKEDFIMKKIELFDPAMCCSTGVCGPSIDPELMRMAVVINALKEKGIVIKRHGVSSEAQDFISTCRSLDKPCLLITLPFSFSALITTAILISSGSIDGPQTPVEQHIA